MNYAVKIGSYWVRESYNQYVIEEKPYVFSTTKDALKAARMLNGEVCKVDTTVLTEDEVLELTGQAITGTTDE